MSVGRRRAIRSQRAFQYAAVFALREVSTSSGRSGVEVRLVIGEGRYVLWVAF